MLNQGNSNIYTPTFVRVQQKTRKRPNHLPLIQGKKVSEKNTAHWLKELLNENVREKTDVPSSVFFSSPSSFLSSTAAFSFRSSCSTRTTYIILQGDVGGWGEVPMIKDKNKRQRKTVITLLWGDRGRDGGMFYLGNEWYLKNIQRSWKWMVLKKIYTKVKKAGMEVHFILEMNGT